MNRLNQEKAEDAFQQFLMEMDDRIEGLQQEAEGYHQGRWFLPLDDPKNINFNQPVIIGHGASKTEFAPMSVCRAFILKKTPGLINKAYVSQLSPRKLDLSKLIEPE